VRRYTDNVSLPFGLVTNDPFIYLNFYIYLQTLIIQSQVSRTVEWKGLSDPVGRVLFIKSPRLSQYWWYQGLACYRERSGTLRKRDKERETSKDD